MARNLSRSRLGVWLICGVMGCAPTPMAQEGEIDAAPIAQRSGDLGVDVAARVGRRDISRTELEARARRDGLDARHALDSLVRDALLLAEAERRGYAQRREVVGSVRRASVRRLLSEIEQSVPMDSIGAAAVRARFDATVARFEQPERRDIIHVLLPLPTVAGDAQEAAAHERMMQLAERLRTTPDTDREALLDEFDRDPQLHVEAVPGVTTTTPFGAPFIQGVFSLEAPGVVPAPVRAHDGWHVIWVRTIHPAITPEFELQRDEVARELLAQARARRVAELLRELRDRASVQLDEARVRALLAQIPAEP